MTVTPSPPPGRDRAKRPRDWARAGVYAGEHQVARLLDRAADFPVVEVAGSRITLPQERHFGDLAGVQRYVDAVLALDWVVRRWPNSAAVPVIVRERRGASKAHYEFDPGADSGTIAVPVRGRESRWALRELVVLHEIAHHLVSNAGGRQGRRDEVAGPPSGARSEQSGTVSNFGGRQGRRDGAPTPLLASPTADTRSRSRQPPLQPRRDGVAGPRSAARSEPSNAAGPGDLGHGPDFTACMLALADGAIGAEIALLLRVAWADQGVPVG